MDVTALVGLVGGVRSLPAQPGTISTVVSAQKAERPGFTICGPAFSNYSDAGGRPDDALRVRGCTGFLGDLEPAIGLEPMTC